MNTRKIEHDIAELKAREAEILGPPGNTGVTFEENRELCEIEERLEVLNKHWEQIGEQRFSDIEDCIILVTENMDTAYAAGVTTGDYSHVEELIDRYGIKIDAPLTNAVVLRIILKSVSGHEVEIVTTDDFRNDPLCDDYTNAQTAAIMREALKIGWLICGRIEQ